MSAPSRKIELDLRPERFAVVRLDRRAQIPWWVESSVFFSVTRTADELSVVCDETALPHSTRAHRGLRCLAVRGPLGFNETGILSALAHPLADAGVSIFTLSTFETDYLFVADDLLARAVEALSEAGHVVNSHAGA